MTVRSRFGALGVIDFRRFELDPVTRRLRKAASVTDLRRMARRRLPRGVFDYIDGGAEDEVALAANVAAYRRFEFAPRVLRDVGEVDITATLLGRPLAMPLVLAPTGFTRIADPAGELAVARAAARAGVPYALSTLGTRSIEEVAAVGSDRLWFQVYVWRDRGLVADLVERAAASGYEALCITVDTAVLGRRERDVRRGFTLPPKVGLVHAARRGDPPRLGVEVRHGPSRSCSPTSPGRGSATEPRRSRLAEYVGRQFDPGLSWDDVAWFRERWNGPIVLKGIQTVADAEHRRRQRGGGDRPLQPRGTAARLGAGAARPAAGRRRGGRGAGRDHLRRRGAAGE